MFATPCGRLTPSTPRPVAVLVPEGLSLRRRRVKHACTDQTKRRYAPEVVPPAPEEVALPAAVVAPPLAGRGDVAGLRAGDDAGLRAVGVAGGLAVDAAGFAAVALRVRAAGFGAVAPRALRAAGLAAGARPVLDA